MNGQGEYDTGLLNYSSAPRARLNWEFSGGFQAHVKSSYG